jgi:hypothetical protein
VQTQPDLHDEKLKALLLEKDEKIKQLETEKDNEVRALKCQLEVRNIYMHILYVCKGWAKIHPALTL